MSWLDAAFYLGFVVGTLLDLFFAWLAASEILKR